MHESVLRPMSEWRVAFIVDNHLLNNWRQGKFISEEIGTELAELQVQGVRRWVRCSEYHRFLTSDYVIAAFEDRIEILDVRNFPATHAVEPIPITLHCSSHVVEANDTILVLYHMGVKVYELDFVSKQWIIKHAFIMTESEILPDDKREWVKLNYDKKTMFVVVKHFIVGYVKGGSKMHIWNFKTGVKLKSEVSPIQKTTIEDIKASRLNLVIVVKQNKSNAATFLAYDLSNLIFLQFNEQIQSPYQFHVFGDCVSIWADSKLRIYNYRSSETKLRDYPLQAHRLQTFGNDIVFIQENTLKLFSHSTSEVKDLVNNVLWFEVLNDKFIQIETIGVYSGRNVYEVLQSNSLRGTSLVLGFKSCGYYLNKHATRYIVRYADGHVLHFW